MGDQEQREVVQEEAGGQGAAALTEERSESPRDGFVPVMEIDLAGDKVSIERDRLEAQLKGLPIKYINDPKAKKEEGAGDKPATKTADNSEGEEAGGDQADDAAIHPLARRAFGGGDEPAVKVEIPKPVNDWFTKNGLGDAATVMAEIPQLRSSIAERDQQLAEANKNLEYLARLSPEAMNVVQMDLDGQDWKKAGPMARPNLDFRRTFEKQDPKAMVEIYAKSVGITNDQWEEFESEEGDPRDKALVQSALALAKSHYEKDAADSTGYLKKRKEDAEAFTKRYNESVGLTMASLIAQEPGAMAHEKKIRESLTQEKVLSMFFNADGSVRPDAAMNAWWVLDREAIMGAKTSALTRKAEADAQRKHLDRTPDRNLTPRKGTGKDGHDQLTGLQKAQQIVRKIW